MTCLRVDNVGMLSLFLYISVHVCQVLVFRFHSETATRACLIACVTWQHQHQAPFGPLFLPCSRSRRRRRAKGIPCLSFTAVVSFVGGASNPTKSGSTAIISGMGCESVRAVERRDQADLVQETFYLAFLSLLLVLEKIRFAAVKVCFSRS